MRLTFVGHASVLLEHGSVSVLCDPWTVGRAFNEAWAPWPAPVLEPAALERVTHLWISHEHPDHLSIPTLRSIPPGRRRGITVLYQHHWSGEVAAFLATMGFADVVELDHGRPHALGGGVDVVLHQVGHEDASLAVRGGGRTVLDLNDCKPSDAKLARIRREVGPVDVLLDQFSYAGWAGNPEDADRRRATAARVLDGLVRHATIVDPRWVVPAASFMAFVTSDSAYLNEDGNGAADVAARLGPTRTAVLLPGDAWDLDEPWLGSAHALERLADLDVLPPEGLLDPAPRALDDVVRQVTEGLGALQAAHLPAVLRRLRPVTFHITDLDARLLVDPAGGVRVLDRDDGSGASVVEATSQALWYAFAHRWGLTTLAISGALRLRGDERPFTRLKQLAAATACGFATRRLARDAVSARGRRYLGRRWRDLVPELLGRVG